MERLTLIVNGTDFSPYINRTGFSYGREKRYGNNGGLMLDGSETVDILARKTVLYLTGNALPPEKMAELLMMCEEDYVAVTFFDPRLNRDRETIFMPEIPQVSVGGWENTTKWFRDGFVLTLREK